MNAPGTDVRRRTRRVAATRGWIIESFNRLMLRRGYDRFGVTDVVTGAGVGRSTFYEHFRGKDEVLRDAVGHVLQTFAAIVDRPDEEAPTRSVAEHIATHRPAAHRILTGPAGEEITRQLAALIDARLAQQCPQGARRSSAATDLPRALIAEHIARAQLGLLRAWVAPVGEPCPPASLASALHRSTRAMVEALTDGTGAAG